MHDAPRPDEWIGVDDVARELNYTRRQSWELVKRLRVRCVGPTRHVMARARFLRSDWEEALNASLRPAAPEPEAPRPAPAAPGASRRRAVPVAPDDISCDWKALLAARGR